MLKMNKISLVLILIVLTPAAYALTANTGSTAIGGGTQLGCECPDGNFVPFGALCSNGSKCTSGINPVDPDPVTPIKNCSAATCSGTDWEQDNSTYQHRVLAWCNDDDECIKMHEYRCARMYYGTSTDGKTGCTFCPPTNNSATAQSIPGENDEVTACYSPKGNFQDSSGYGYFSDDCYYVE